MIPLSLAVIGLLVLLYFRERAHDRERQTLLDRIQAPEVVIAQRSIVDDDDIVESPILGADGDFYMDGKRVDN